jgi:hypothetical protein
MHGVHTPPVPLTTFSLSPNQPAIQPQLPPVMLHLLLLLQVLVPRVTTTTTTPVSTSPPAPKTTHTLQLLSFSVLSLLLI